MQAPRHPVARPIGLDGMSLAASRDAMTAMAPEPAIESALLAIVDRWRADAAAATPLQELRALLEQLRGRMRGSRRIEGMNTLARTLGRPDMLAAFLEMLTGAALKKGTAEQQIALTSQQGRMHSIYGWSGQTTIVLSSPDPVDATSPPNDVDVSGRLGYPQPLWWISLHIWQPNPKATGFVSGKRPEPGIILEPPHSHPFDFVSMMAVGHMRQSVYEPLAGAGAPGLNRYDDVLLEHVDGVWPPHRQRRSVGLRTVEDRLVIAAGDSYFMPFHRIHDVEVDAREAMTKPAITLFIASESQALADVFMAGSMADFHAEHPDILERARPLSLDDWRAKLGATATYLRGECDTLRLAEIVRTDDAYAFLHV